MKASRQDIYNAVIRRMVQESLTAKHEGFALEHEKDTDEQLICYLRSCACQLGHPPHQKEIIGWPLITARFGSWSDALRAAGLPYPTAPNTPSKFAVVLAEEEEQKRIYREKKERKKRQAEQRLAEQERRKKEHKKKAVPGADEG